MIEPEHPSLSIIHQCELVGLARSSYYREPGRESQENLELMRLIDEQYTRTPFYGSRRMTAWLRTEGHQVNRKRVQRLMRQMGIEAMYPRPGLSQGSAEHRVYPYLLRGVTIDHPQQVWSTDITYIRLRAGFVYLVAILDWHSRYLVSWELSNSLEVSFCLEALDRALSEAQPEIFNSDQGVQFTSRVFTARLEAAGVRVSMDGRGRVFDNIFVERLWRTVKYEEVYLHDYDSLATARQRLHQYFQFYNHQRGHQALGYRTPAAVYFG
jgi:putative transposase